MATLEFSRVHSYPSMLAGISMPVVLKCGDDRRTFGTATGSAVAFGHVVQLKILGLTFEATVYFFADEGIRKNLMGRTGCLDRIRLGLVHYDCEMLVAAYDS